MKFINKFFLIFLIFIFHFQIYAGQNYEKFSDTKLAIGTSLTITFFSYDKKSAKSILKQCFELARTLENKASCRIPDSIITRLNKEKNLIIYDDFIYNLIVESIRYSAETNGTFDPSLYNLISLWGFDSDSANRVPSAEEINKALASTGYKNINIINNRVMLRNNISLDLGGIAKGRIISEICSFLKKNNIKDYLVNGGGDLIVAGMYEGKRLWIIAIADPFDANKYIGFLNLTDCRVATSGDYQRYFMGPDKKLYHHIFDPKTGYPADNGVHSVTIISYLPLRNDIFPSVAFFVMGEKQGLSFAEKNNISVIYVSGDKDNKMISTTSDIIIDKSSNKGFEFIYKKIMKQQGRL